MVKLIIASTILATAAAFLGVAPSAPAPQLHAAGIEDYIGADIETAGLWDPLGLSKDTDRLYRWRCVEIKHGRVAMLATVGYLYNDLKLTLPGVLSPVPIAGWVQMIFFIGVMETTVFKQDPAKAPGDVGGVFFRRYSDPAEKADKLKSELKNGRLAMMGIMGMLVTDQLTGLGPVTQLMTTKVVPF
ncbi:chlorophyll A-B binding protein [Aureococcus anophagefferens]|nr:chlorophyll A-B binding protein [Aureococcus anophagefferens]KAH8064719.1 chlorophyll A-B binding protein [Aureococcus anophagefferens]